MFHILKPKRSYIQGFYNNDHEIYVGKSSPVVMAHELLHLLGAPDLYIHDYWPGKRRRLVKHHMDREIMNSPVEGETSCKSYLISPFTRACMAWSDSMPKIHEPLLKYNQLAYFRYLRARNKNY